MARGQYLALSNDLPSLQSFLTNLFNTYEITHITIANMRTAKREHETTRTGTSATFSNGLTPPILAPTTGKPHMLLVIRFYARKQLCFQRVLAIAILSVCLSIRLSVTRVDQAKTVQAKISKSSPLAAWKTLVSGTVKLFRKFERGHSERGR